MAIKIKLALNWIIDLFKTRYKITVSFNKEYGDADDKTYIINEKEKKRAYNERVLQVENGTFTPLVFSVFVRLGEKMFKMFFQKALIHALREEK